MIKAELIIGTREELLEFFSFILPYSKDIEFKLNTCYESNCTILSQLDLIKEGFGTIWYIKYEKCILFAQEIESKVLKSVFVKMINNSSSCNHGDDDDGC